MEIGQRLERDINTEKEEEFEIKAEKTQKK